MHFPRPLALCIFLTASLGAAVAVAAPPTTWEVWKSDVTTLRPRESFQQRIAFDQIPVRAWKLLIEGDQVRCDVNVVRLRDESLVYDHTDESRHEVLVPWGRGEEVIIVVVNRDREATFTISLLGPPRDQPLAAYGYHVNRALEAFAGGRRLEAEAECRAALQDDPRDGVAKVLLAGFLRDGRYLDQAATLVEEALASDLPPDMRGLAQDLRAELRQLRAPLPTPVRQGLDQAERDLGDGRSEAALVAVTSLLESDLEYDTAARAVLLTTKGRALAAVGRNFEAIDALTQALALTRDRGDAAVVYYHMGRLYAAMDNGEQAEGALAMALEGGLPSGLALQAREALRDLRTRRAPADR